MISRELTWDVSKDGLSIAPTAPQDGGTQGDHNVTRAVFKVAEGSVWADPANAVYIECEDGAGNVDTTEQLSVVDGKVSYLLPRAWTQYGGTVTLRLVAEGPGVEGVLAYSPYVSVRFESRQNAMHKVDSLMKGRLAQAEERANKALDTAEETLNVAELAKTVAGEAASAAAESSAAAASSAGAAAEAARDAQAAAQKASQHQAISEQAATFAGEARDEAVAARDEATDAVLAAKNAAQSAAALAASAATSQEGARQAVTDAAWAKTAAESAAASAVVSREGAQQFSAAADRAKAAAERAAASASVSSDGAQAAAKEAKKAVSGKVDKFDTDEYSFCLCDEDGNVIAAYDKNGKPLTKDPEREQELKAIRDRIATLGKSKVTAFYTEEYAWCFCDEDGNVCVGQLPSGEKVGFGDASALEQALQEVWDAIDNLPAGGGGTGYFNYKQCGLPVLYLQEQEKGAHKDMIAAGESKLEKKFDYTLKTAKGSPVSSGVCDLKFQGSSSLRNNYPKYNYTFKANKGLDFEAVRDISEEKAVAWPKDSEREVKEFEKPWGEQRKYCLKANFIDPSGARNVVSARLWASIVKSRTLSKVVSAADTRLLAAPNCGAIDGFPVIIELNGEFRGLYTFNIPKEDWMFNGVNDEGDIKYIVGCESNDNRVPAAAFAASARFPEGVAQNLTDFAIEYIPDEDDPVAKQELIDSFNAAISAVMDAKAQAAQNPDYDWEAAVSPHFDIASAIDYYIFTCCISGMDNLRKNILYATYGSTEDGVPDKWFMSAYDLDTTFGSNPYGKGLYRVKTDTTQFKEASDRHNLFYLIYHYSHDKLMARYNELRNGIDSADRELSDGILSDQNVWYVFNNFVNAIPKAVYNADADRWASASQSRPMHGTTTANVENYMQYYRMHCALLDKEMEE